MAREMACGESQRVGLVLAENRTADSPSGDQSRGGRRRGRSDEATARTRFRHAALEAVLELSERLPTRVLSPRKTRSTIFREAIARESPLQMMATPLGDNRALAILGRQALNEDEEEAQLLAQLRLESVRVKEKLLERAGGTKSTAEVAHHLKMSGAGVGKRRKEGKLIAVDLGNRDYRYPAFQFTPEGTLPGLERVLMLLREYDAWGQLSFLLNPNSRLDDQTPTTALAASKVDEVARAASVFGEHGAP